MACPDCCAAADAPAFKVAQKRSGLQRAYLHIPESRLIPSVTGYWTCSRLQCFRKRQSRNFGHIFYLTYEIVRTKQLSGKGEYVSAFPGSEVIPQLFCGIHLERCRLFIPVRRPVPEFGPLVSDGSMPEPGKKVLQRNIPHRLYIHGRQFMMNLTPMPYCV